MAFEHDAFQGNAFQTGSEQKKPLTAFQGDAFQANALQIGSLPASADVTVALSGASMTASAGTLGVSIAVAQSGSSASVSAGTLSPSLLIPLIGEQPSVSAGLISPTFDIALSSEQITVSPGDMGVIIVENPTISGSAPGWAERKHKRDREYPERGYLVEIEVIPQQRIEKAVREAVATIERQSPGNRVLSEIYAEYSDAKNTDSALQINLDALSRDMALAERVLSEYLELQISQRKRAEAEAIQRQLNEELEEFLLMMLMSD